MECLCGGERRLDFSEFQRAGLGWAWLGLWSFTAFTRARGGFELWWRVGVEVVGGVGFLCCTLTSSHLILADITLYLTLLPYLTAPGCTHMSN